MGVLVRGRCWLCAAGAVTLLCGASCLFGVGVAAAVTQFGGQGVGTGKFKGPFGVAVDRATGDVYVPDLDNWRVDKFGPSGSFLLAWGWKVNLESPAQELQTCTAASGCSAASFGSGAGEFASEGPQGLAVDENSPTGDSSAEDVYVEDWEGFRVEKFTPSGEFVSMFGGGVNKNGTNVCVRAEAVECQSGAPGVGDGQFEWAYSADGIVAVGPAGRVYVGDRARVEVFEASGAWRENISLAGISSVGRVTSLAVNAAGDVFVKDEGVAGVR
jgi:tripartite motif-containing protein 71